MAFEPEQIPSGTAFALSSENTRYRQDLSRLVPNYSDQPLFLAFDIVLTTAVPVQRFLCEGGIPQRWIISLLPQVGIVVNAYMGPEASGVGIKMSGGSVITLPSFDEYLTLVLVTGASASGNVLALRKYDFIVLDSGIG